MSQRHRLDEAAKLTGYSHAHLWRLVNAGTLRTEQANPRAHHFVTDDELRRVLKFRASQQESAATK